MSIIQRLVAQLGFEVDTTGLDKFNRAIGDVKTSITRLSQVATVAAAGIFALTKVSANEADQLSRTSQQLGISTKALQEYSKAAQIAGHAPEELISALGTLKKKAEDSRFGDAGAIQGFSRLGVNIRNQSGTIKSAEDLLGSVADKISNVKDPTIKRKILVDLGISENLIPLLDQGSEGIKSLTSEASAASYIFTDKDKNNLREFNKSLSLFLSVLGAIRNELSSKLSPAFTKLFNQFKEFVIKNKEWISSGIDKFVEFVGAAFRSLSNVAEGLFKIFSSLSELIGGKLTLALTIMLGLITLIGAKFALLLAAAAAVYVVIDDIIGFFNGKDSVTGLIVDNMKKMFDTLDSYVTNLISVEWPKKINSFVQSIKFGLANSIPGGSALGILDPNSEEFKNKQNSKFSNPSSIFKTEALNGNNLFSALNFAKDLSSGAGFSKLKDRGNSEINQTNYITINAENAEVGNSLRDQIQKTFNGMKDDDNRFATQFNSGNIVK